MKTRRLGLASCSLALAAVACSSAGAEDGAVSSDGSLTEAPLAGRVCNAPVVSTSGVYALVDYCPSAGGGAPGKLVRRELASATETTVATYGAGERLARLGASGDVFHYATLHATSAPADGPTWHVTVNDWATLATARDVVPNPHPASPSTYGVPLDVVVAPDGKSVVLTAVLDTLVAQPFEPGIGTTSWTEKALHTMVASLDGAAFTASVIPKGAVPTTYFWKDLPQNRFDFAPDGKSVLFTTGSNGSGYLPAAYPITLGPTPVSSGIAAGKVLAGSWNGASYAEVRSVPVGFSTTPQLAVVTPPTRSGPVLCDDLPHTAQVAGSSLLFVCYDVPGDRDTLVARPIDGSGPSRTLATVDVKAGDFDASQQIHKVLVTADGLNMLYFVGHSWFDVPTLGSDNQLAAAAVAVYVGPVDGSKPPHQTIAELKIAETAALGEDQLLVHDRPGPGMDHYGVLDVRTGQIVSSVTGAEAAWRAESVTAGALAITKDGSSVFDSQQCKVGPESWQTGWQPTITHGGVTTTGTCLAGAGVGFIPVPLHDAAVATFRQSAETFTWAGGTYGHSIYAVSYVAP